MITIPYLTALTTYFSYGLLFAFGQLRDFFRKIFDWWSHNSLEGYAPICLGLEDFYIRRLYLRIQLVVKKLIALTGQYVALPDAWFDVVERISNDYNKTLKRTTRVARCLNLGSYNYLGFAAADEYCTPRAIESLKKFSASTCSTRVDGGTTTLHIELEECVANFVGKPAAVVFGMGYATNSAILPVLIGKGGLIISDSLNHNSIVNGARGSGATIRVFQHNTPSNLEKVLREQIAEGQPRTHRPWKKIIVVVEGIYSMEGELCQLPEIVSICKKYRELIEYLKHNCPAHLYATSISPPAAQQIISSIKVILGEDGSSRGWDLSALCFATQDRVCRCLFPNYSLSVLCQYRAQKLARIRENSNFFRSELQKMGFEVLGDNDSPVMPIMLYNPAKIPAFSRECLKRNVAVVTVAFPATPLLLARARICISAAHTREDLIRALEVISRVGDMVGVKYFPAEPKKQQLEGEGIKMD
ncbi:UNVERIFIED_CONTAM: Long chain base biosynthesis protein 2a [Sesamum angustifolium]|uniref:Long chain base biosynthesis protein 2a n=1 Tax=Sesamum angustifolium TaxID=2727405 RepID=A0AAW2LIS3_9LAMI